MENIELTPVGATDHTRGPASAPVTLIEYGDFQCPYCSEAHTIVSELERRFSGRMRFVFRQFPLREIHPRAAAAAQAAEAAGAQGKFWEMYDELFTHQRALADADFRRYARSAGVGDLERFDRELTTNAYQHAIDAAIEQGESSGVDGTPMFFINGQPFADEPTLESLSAALDAAAQDEM